VTYRVLIVDDSKFMRMLLADLLTRSGFEVIEAESGEQAVDVYLEERPDLVTLDILMPGRDGIETLQDLRAQAPEVRVVMVTALGMEDYIKRALDARPNRLRPESGRPGPGPGEPPGRPERSGSCWKGPGSRLETAPPPPAGTPFPSG